MEADTLTIRLGATPSGLTNASSIPPYFYRLDALPAAQPTAAKQCYDSTAVADSSGFHVGPWCKPSLMHTQYFFNCRFDRRRLCFVCVYRRGRPTVAVLFCEQLLVLRRTTMTLYCLVSHELGSSAMNRA